MKKTVSVILCAVLLLSCLCISPVADEIMRGDINGDAKINTKDYIMLKRYVLKTYSIDASILMQCADINRDKKVDSKDYIMLKRVVLGTYILPLDDGSIPSSKVKFPHNGSLLGQLTIEGTEIKNVPVYFGDSDKILKQGAGMYTGSSFPGMGSTCLISAHNDTFFHYLGTARKGSKITVTTKYGTYQYRITKTAKLPYTDENAFDLAAEEENLVLYTCYPFSTIRATETRYYVYTEYVFGPMIRLDM